MMTLLVAAERPRTEPSKLSLKMLVGGGSQVMIVGWLVDEVFDEEMIL